VARVARQVRPLAALFALALVQFWPLVLHPNQTLYSDTSDLLAQHLPAKLFLVRSLRETGELPLWNPEQYAGSPFVHDIQVGLFYPPNLPLYFLPESAVGPFLCWLVFAHVVLAGWLMYAYARHAGLSELAGFTAAAGYMLAPRWMMQLLLAGHTVTVGIAWIPLVLLCVERAILRRSWRWAVGGGVTYALLVLGTHPQWTFYGSLLIGLWPLRVLAESTTTRSFVFRWLAVEIVVVAIGIGLCAVQLLPTIEAAGESSRAKGMAQSWSLDGARAAFPTLVGPFPERVAEGVHWEARGGIGFTWAVLALAGVGLGGRPARVPALIAVGMLAYALGGSALVDRLPGFSTFRMPTRMLLTLAFPVAYLAGLGVQALAREWSTSTLGGATVVVFVIVLAPGLLSALSGQFPKLAALNPGWRAYWLAVPAAWVAFLVIAPRQSGRARVLALVALLVGDLFLFSFRYPATRPMDEIYPRSPLVDPIRDEQLAGALVYDPDVNDAGDCFLGPGSPMASVYGVRSIRGYNPLDVARYRQFLAFIADVGEPQRAFSGNFTNPVMHGEGFPIKNRRLFDLLGVAWELAPVDDPPASGGWIGVAGAVDPAARSYNFLGRGVRDLPPMRLYFNVQSMPRAFVVPAAVPEAGDADVLKQLKGLDPWQTATLAGWDPSADPLPAEGAGRRWQQVVDARPNSLTVQLDGKSGGLLVLTDPWYPGWRCWIDGQEVPIWKANYAFRGVMVSKGAREIKFRFEPRSYRVGRLVSVATLVGVMITFAFGAAFRFRARSAPGRKTPVR
jgi:hypothetical protein